MTTPDRTQDLLRQMLERRAGAPPPGWLLPSVADSVRQTRQVRRGPSWPGLPAMPRLKRLALIAAAAILLLALAAGVLVAAGIILPAPEPSPRAIVLAPSPSATAEPATFEPTEAPANRPPTVTPAPSAFAADSIAVVTNAGDGLRVRSNPNVGSGSEKYSPLLKKGSRMLVVDGPVSADGYDWYEVQPQDGPFGWVAAGKGGEDWIAPAEPECTDDLDETAVRTVDPIDFVVCYGNTPVSVQVDWSSLEDGIDVEGPACPYTGDNVQCSARPNWLFEPHDLTFVAPGASPDLLAAAHGSVLDQMRAVPEPSPMTLTVAMDAAQAQNCRIVDARGHDLISRDEAITRCRLTFVVRDVEWNAADVRLDANTLARVIGPRLPVYESSAGSTRLGSLVQGDEVLIADEPEVVDGLRWYPVFPSDRAGRPFGWVPFIGDGGAPTLAAVNIDCPAPRSWRSIVALSPAARLVCFRARELTMNVRVVRDHLPFSIEGACITYRSSAATPYPCNPQPAWLAMGSGVTGRDPRDHGPGIELRFNPDQVNRDWFTSTPTIMGVTGSFSNEAANECNMFEPGADHPPLADLETRNYCREQFVVTAVGSPAR